MFEHSDTQQNCQDFYVETLSHVSAFLGSYNAGVDFRIPLPPSHPSLFRHPGQTVLWALVRNQFPLSRTQNLVQEIRRECALTCDSVSTILLPGTGNVKDFYMRQRSCDSVNTLLCPAHFDQLFVPNLTSNLTHKSPFFTPFLAAHHKNSFLIGLRSVGLCPPYSASPSSPFYDLSPQIFAPGTLVLLGNLHPLSRTQSLVQGVRRECELHATAFMRQRCFLS